MKRRRYRRRARRNPISKKGTVFLGALVLGAGALAWYLWPKAEAEQQLPQGGGGGGGQLPPKTDQTQLQRIAQAAHDELAKFEAWLAQNMDTIKKDPVAVASAQKKLEQLKIAYRDAAARAGVQVSV